MDKRVVAAFLCFSGCSVGPSIQIPEMHLEGEYASVSSCEEGCFEEKGDLEDLKDWWRHFSDPRLDELIALAKEQNPNILVASARIDEARGVYRRISGELWPSIDLRASAIRSGFSRNITEAELLGLSEQSQFYLGFDAVWELDFFGRLSGRKEAAIYAVFGEEEAFRNVLLIVYAEVAKTYVEICALEQDLQVLREIVETAQQILYLQEAAYEAGLLDRQQVEEIETILQEQKALVVQRSVALQEFHHRLAALIGEFPNSASSAFSGLKTIPKAPRLVQVGIPSDLLRRRPDIREAEYKIALATRLLGSAIAELFPSFSLTADWGLRSNRLSRWFQSESDSWNIGPSFITPIFRFGRILGLIDEQEGALDVAMNTYKNKVLLAVEDSENALTVYCNAIRLQALRQKAFQAKETEASLQHELFISGLAPWIEYLQTHFASLERKRELIAAERAESVNLIALYKALGGGWSC
ncbi:MAG: efflux transporter outer membrane subunit [Chlamydiota bacterium]